MNPKIPPENADILAAIQIKYRKVAFVSIGWAVLVTLFEILYVHDYFSARLNPLSSIVIWIALAIIPFIKMKGPQILLDRGWRGTLVELTYDREVKADASSRRKLLYTGVAQFTIRDGERIILYKLPLEKLSSRLHYRVGDNLIRFAGTRYPVYADEPENRTQICPLCGSRIEPDATQCFYCHHSRIKTSVPDIK